MYNILLTKFGHAEKARPVCIGSKISVRGAYRVSAVTRRKCTVEPRGLIGRESHGARTGEEIRFYTRCSTRRVSAYPFSRARG